MEAEDIIKVFNKYILTQRLKQNLDTKGYLVIKKNTEKASSFTNIYTNYIYEIFYVNSKREIISIHKTTLRYKSDQKDGWDKVSNFILEDMFNLRDTEYFQQILEDTYDSNK